MKEEGLLGREVGVEQEEEEDNVGEVGEARWGMSFLSLAAPLLLHHLRSPKLFGTLLALANWRTLSHTLALQIFYSLLAFTDFLHLLKFKRRLISQAAQILQRTCLDVSEMEIRLNIKADTYIGKH